jgi:hypothetical protein
VGEWNTVVGVKSWHITVGPYGMRRKKSEVKCSLIFVKCMDLVPPTHGLKSLREECTPGKHWEIVIDISRTICLWNSGSETM